MSTLIASTATSFADPQPAVLVGFRAAGTLDRTSAGPFLSLMASESHGTDRIVVLDVAEVHVGDVAGLRTLDALRQLRDEPGSVFLLRGITGARDEILRADRRLRELRTQPVAGTG